MDKPTFVYVTYIETTAEKLWEALTRSEFTNQYWFGTEVESDWEVGSPVVFRRGGKEVSYDQTVLKSEPPRLLSYTWGSACCGQTKEKPSRVTFEIESLGVTAERAGKGVKLMVTHDDFPPGSTVFPGISKGWPAVLSGLKTLLETNSAMVIPMG